MNFDIDTDQGLVNSMMWTKNLIGTLRDGGSWAVPRSQAIYTFDKVQKVAKREGCDRAVDRVLVALGWKLC